MTGVRNTFRKRCLLAVIITAIMLSLFGCGKSGPKEEKTGEKATGVQSEAPKETAENGQPGSEQEDGSEEKAQGENTNPLMNCEVLEAEIKDESGNSAGTRGYIHFPSDELADLTSKQIAEFSLNVVDRKNYDYFTVDFGTGKGIYYPECSIDRVMIGDIDNAGKITNTEKYLFVSRDGKLRMEDAGEEAPAQTDEQVDQVETQEVMSEADREGLDKLQSMGNIQTENGILTVTITLPADLAEGITEEELDAGKGENYISAVRNQDGSVTYKMTKQQHKKMLTQLTETFDSSLQELINDETYTVSNITHNRDFTVFDVTLEGTELGFSDSFSALSMYMYGGMYGVFSGQRPEHVIVNFRDPNGNLIQSGDSADIKTTAQ
jgi:predicted small lipoprotein YifL